MPSAWPPPTDDGERLAKRLARDLSCSRSAAERYIEAGFVTVDDVVVDTPPSRVRPTQRVQLLRGATPAALEPVTLLLHKPADVDAADGAQPADGFLVPDRRASDDRGGVRTVSAHLRRQQCVTPLEVSASGLVVYSQDPRIVRRLQENAATLEHEWMVDVAGTVSADALAALNRADPAVPPAGATMRVSVGSGDDDATRLRVAVKGHQPGRIERACAAAGLRVTAIRRTRIGRVPLAGLAAGRWRYLSAGERF